MVANTIAARKYLGVKRQVFFVSMGGFDHHDYLLDHHNRDLSRVSRAIGSFYAAIKELKLEKQVTTFTISEFARTLTSNGDGSDHAWEELLWSSGFSKWKKNVWEIPES